MISRLVLATRNGKKLRELQEILSDLPLELLTLEHFPDVPEVAETGSTFEENAELKARAVAQATRCWALADDSGLVVDALGGRPGIYSARYAGESATDASNRSKLLAELKGIPGRTRTARFVCVVALVSPEGALYLHRGECEGVILDEERGTGGFGYDPLFWVESAGQTMAELPAEAKHRLSHRGRALEQLRRTLGGLSEM